MNCLGRCCCCRCNGGGIFTSTRCFFATLLFESLALLFRFDALRLQQLGTSQILNFFFEFGSE